MVWGSVRGKEKKFNKAYDKFLNVSVSFWRTLVPVGVQLWPPNWVLLKGWDQVSLIRRYQLPYIKVEVIWLFKRNR